MNEEYIKQVKFWFHFLKIETGTWADVTFPKSDSYSVLAHMHEELQELGDAVLHEDAVNIEDEAADLLLLLLHLCYKNEVDIGAAALRKLEINKKRIWDTEPNDKGYYKHQEKDSEQK